MNAVSLTEGAASIDIPKALVQFFVTTSPPAVEVVLEAVDADGEALFEPRWSYQSPRWVLDPSGLSEGTAGVRARSADGAGFPARTELKCLVVAGSRQFFAHFNDITGRTARDLFQLELSSQALRLRRAPRLARSSGGADPTPTGDSRSARVKLPDRQVRILIDGSASMRAPTVRPSVERTVEAIGDVVSAGRGDEQVKVSWHVVRDGHSRPLGADASAEAVLAQPSSIGSAFDQTLFRRAGHYIVVTDDIPDAVDQWTIPSDSTVQVVVVGPVRHPREPVGNGIQITLGAGAEDSTALIAQVAAGLGWNE